MTTFDHDRATMDRQSVDMRQFADLRQAALPSGLRVIDGYNSSGLTVTVLPDRGLDVWLAAHNGRPLTWISQGSPHAPDFGAGWLRQFNGGLLVTCGLRHAGPPETDERSGQWRDLHGDASLLRAWNVAVNRGWHGDRYVVEVTGELAEAALFGEQLHLARTIRLVLGEPALEIIDVVENRYDAPAPFMLLHHFNFGYPLVNQATTLTVAAAATVPRDLQAALALHDWPHYQAAVPRHLEEVFFHQVLADENGMAVAVLASDEFGLAVEWDTTHEPYLTQWKNYRNGTYVCGVEPGNCLPEGQNRARREGRLVHLAPGEQQTFRNKLTVLDGAAAVQSVRERVGRLAQSGRPVSVSFAGYIV